MTDLTERLAAKLYEGPYFNTAESDRVARYADVVLPVLLSEPELVASLSDEVRRSVLTERERAVMKLGEAALSPGISLDNVAGYFTDIQQFLAALAEARALPPPPAPMEGTNDD